MRASTIILVLLAVVLAPPLCQALDLPFKSNREIREEQQDAGAAQDQGPRTSAEAETAGGAQAAGADPTQPILEVALDETQAFPGQPLDLRMTVLVPTYLLEPPTWPRLDVPNLLVRLPEGATVPTSRQIAGQSWSGVSRRYRIAPMTVGSFRIPAAEVVLTYADPQTNEPVTARLATEPLALSGVLPEGAEDLDPFIAADSLELTQQLEGKPEAMAPRDSLVRTVTATIRGASPIILPDLLPPMAVPGIAAYPDEPVLEEQDEGQGPGGTRTERVTLVAEGGGRGEAPPVALRWYNIGSGEIETASLEGFQISVEGPPVRTDGRADRRWLVALGGLGVAALGALAFLRWALPPLRRWGRQRRDAWLASERHAYRRLRKTIAKRDYAGLHPALDAWAGRVLESDPRLDPRLHQALLDLGVVRYGRNDAADTESAWRALDSALAAAHRSSTAGSTTAATLPRLNPPMPSRGS